MGGNNMPWQDVAMALIIALCVAASLLATRYQESLGPDEAYLWYGVLRLFQGEVPQRDFRSYEPGRYLWCALFALILGRGLWPVRLATHVFYGLCLGAALATLRYVGLSWLDVLLVAVLLGAWAHPMHKLYEPGLMLVGFSASAWLVLDPSPLTAAVAGASVGIALLFGFNHFLYRGAALVLLFVTALGLSSITLPFELFAWAFLGGVLGALPFAAFSLAPGFLRAFIERRITSILKRGATNLPMPMPWPWRPAPLQLQSENRVRQLAYGALFVMLPAAPALALIAHWVWDPAVSDRSLAAIAAASLAAVGWHHAYSRASTAHLAQSIAPLLIMVSLFLTSSLALAIMVVGSVALTWTLHPQVQRRRAPQRFMPLQLDGLRIWVRALEHRIVQRAAELSEHHLAHGGSLLAQPSLIALYAIFGRRAPVYDIYSVFPASLAEQERMLASIAKADVRVAFVSDAPLDGRDELRFSNTHPLVWRHLLATMEKVQELPGAVHVFCERTAPIAGASTSLST
jgi:hypothetical protein